MTYEIYRYVFIGGAALSVIMLIVSVTLFFGFNIPNVIGDLTGSNARKGIENIRNRNQITGQKTYKSSKVNKDRGKVTSKIGVEIHTDNLKVGAMGTSKLDAPASETTLLNTASETTLLNTGSETTILSAANETTILSEQVPSNETTLLVEHPIFYGNETAVLDESQLLPEDFTIEFDITYVFSDETIE